MDEPNPAPFPETGNAPTWSVSELSNALKRTLEDAYGFVRLRGELSKVSFHSNGHVYLDIKDEGACLAGVIWRRTAATLATRPEQGMEVVVTGRITTFAKRSQYQLVIDTLAPAGVGALLAQLERLKKALAAEGLFAAERKRRLPFAPTVIGVVTSPTGAVIRDILHRLRDRWPCRVIVWPVVVQGPSAAKEARAAIEGFAGFDPRPDLVIVARGGGSVEDLWPFNDEALVRAVAASPIPILSAIGHETDTTLIDLAADLRAPTPTGAAELASPVLADLAASIADLHNRLIRRVGAALEDRRLRLAGAARGLPRPEDIVAMAGQRLDLAAGRLAGALQRNVDAHARVLAERAAPIRPATLARAIATRRERLEQGAERLAPGLSRTLQRAHERLLGLDKLRLSFNPNGPLARGFARVHRADGRLARAAATLATGEAVRLVFADGEKGARIDGAAAPPSVRRRASVATGGQGDLF